MFVLNQTVSQLVWPFLGLFQSELEIEPFPDFGGSETRSTKHHVTAARRIFRSRDHCASEFELRMSRDLRVSRKRASRVGV